MTNNDYRPTWDPFKETVHKRLKGLLETRYGVDDAWVLSNLVFHLKTGETINIDHIIVCPGGVFTVEDRNVDGMILANRSDETWNQAIPGLFGSISKNPFSSPIMQNSNHIRFLERVFKPRGLRIPFRGIAVFPNEADFKNFTASDVIKMQKLENFIFSLPHVLYTEPGESNLWLQIIREFKDKLQEYNRAGN